MTSDLAHITPSEILQAIYGPWADNVHVTSFAGPVRDGGHWKGYRVSDRHDDPSQLSFPEDHNVYFAVGMMSRESEGRAGRNHVADYLIVIDDVGQKVEREKVDALRAQAVVPCMVLQSSPGNWQYFYRIDDPVFRTDMDRPERPILVDMIRDAIKTKGWGDKAVQDEVRYMRLPFGINGKHGGKVERTEWNPDTTVTLDLLAEVFVGSDWRDQLAAGGKARRSPPSGAGYDRHASMDDACVQLAAEIGLSPHEIRPGVVSAACPNAANHSTSDPTGFDFVNPYRCYCNHDGCQGITSAGFMDLMEGQYEADVRSRLSAGELRDDGGTLRDRSGNAVPRTGRTWMANYQFSRSPIDRVELERAFRAAADYEEHRDKTPAWVRELNERFCVIPGIAGVVDFGERADQTQHYDVLTVAHFQTMFRNERVPVEGEKKRRPMGAAWLDHPARREYRDIGLWPIGKEPTGMLNLWTGVPMPKGDAPAGTSIALFLDYVFRGVCDSDFVKFDWTLNWLAWLVQNPLEKPGTNLALVGGQGTGKSTFGRLAMDIFGPRFSLHIQNDKHVLSNFNAHLEGKRLVLMDEALFGKDPRVLGLYKALSTERFMMIERKGVNARPVPNILAMIIASNSLAAVPVGEAGERRTTVFRVSEVFRNDTGFFAKLWAEWNDFGREGVIEMCRTRDLSKFDPRICLNTPEKAAMASATGDVVTRWWLDRCNSGRAPGGGDWSGVVKVTFQELLADHSAWASAQHLRAATLEEVLAGVRALCGETRDIRPSAPVGHKRPRGFELPSADRALELATAALGGGGTSGPSLLVH